MKIFDAVIYCPLANTGHHNACVIDMRADGSVDIELDKKQTGAGDPVRLMHIPVVDSLKDLTPGTCAKATR